MRKFRRDSVRVSVWISPAAAIVLDRLTRSGCYGGTRAGTAKKILTERVKELIDAAA